MAELPAKLDAAVRSVAARLAQVGIEPAFTEARLIFELAGFDRMALLKAPDEVLNAIQTSIILSALEKRLSGMPVARIRGWSWFDGRRFELSAETLEPRDDTLALVDAVMDFVRTTPNCRILDIGTGTGIIALTLLARVPHAVALATDISEGALETAKRNGLALGFGARLRVQKADMLDEIEEQFDLIISNPPYIASKVVKQLTREVRDHDPLAALDGGMDGLEFYRRIAKDAGKLLAPNGRVAVEIGFDQRASVSAIFVEAGLSALSFHKDLGDRPRALVFTQFKQPC